MTGHRQVHTLIVGAGIVGVSTAYELAKSGMTDVLVIDKSDLFRTGGSTSHAPGGVFQNNSSRTVSKLAQWSVRTFREMSATGPQLYFPVGSLEIATTEARWHDLKRKAGYARSWGLTARLLDPVETGAVLPHLDTSLILGAIHVEGDGIVRSVPMVERMAAAATNLGVSFVGRAELQMIKTRNARVVGAETSIGHVACERVLLCGGIWGPLLGKIASIPIPLQPCAHPYIRSKPHPALSGLQEIEQPLWRHQDHSMYLWQDGDRLGVGNYRHEPHLVDPSLIENRSSAPAELPFDVTMMEPGIREARRLLPGLANFDVQDRVYGMFSFTPDGQSIVGESASIKGLWSAIGVWVTHAPGIGRAVAQLMSTGSCQLDLRELDVNRFAPHQSARSFVLQRGGQQYREVYDVIHPRYQISAPRGLRRTPWYPHQKELGAHFFESNGWERAQWYTANQHLPMPELGVCRDAWSAIEWSPIAAAEHNATRAGAGLFDLGTFMRIEISGPDALAALHRISCSWIDRPVGRVAYALMLNNNGGIESDVTIARLGSDRFMVMTGSASGPRDLAWIRQNARDFSSLRIEDVTSSWCALAVWGPKAIAMLQSIAESPIDAQTLPPYSFHEVMVAGIPTLAMNMSYVGEFGLELHTSTEYGAALWEAVWASGEKQGLVAAGGVAMDSLRLEVGYRALGSDLRGEYSPSEAGLDFAVDNSRSDYIGASSLAQRQIQRRLVCMTAPDTSVMFLGKEPIFDGEAVVGYVSSAGFGYTTGERICLGYVPQHLSDPGTELAVEYFDNRYTVRVANEPMLANARSRD
ncbi:FAD-dependent oxidoreductase [soil metagenome]